MVSEQKYLVTCSGLKLDRIVKLLQHKNPYIFNFQQSPRSA